MDPSAHDQPSGTVKSVRSGAIMAEAAADASGQGVVATITRGGFERLNLREGEAVTAMIKATEATFAQWAHRPISRPPDPARAALCGG